MSFAVSDDLARRINGAVNSGREIALIFVMKARRVVDDDATRSFSPDAEQTAARI